MRLELYRAHWEIILTLVSDWKPAAEKIAAALQSEGDVIGVEMAIEGGRKLADRIEKWSWPVANYIRGLCNAAMTPNW